MFIFVNCTVEASYLVTAIKADLREGAYYVCQWIYAII